ncbi:MAG: beta-lactamase family protein [Clostridiales bacterium]|jgi:CubicO group peptidase (beta-lactamase class C family)|nr:beta-lactamase family protein [Clostridiales bacterium]
MKKIENLIENGFNGVVSVSKNSEAIFKKAYGYADLSNKRPNQTDTKFGTASAGKAFVAVGIMKLIEDGMLSLESKIGDLLDFDLREIAKDITVKQLLNHTSGIPDYFDEAVMDDYAELWSENPSYKFRRSTDLMPLFIDKPMMYAPGERFQYNNTGYVVLGLIIESVTGVPFDEYLLNSVFEPCGMVNTGYYELDRLPPNCANAYIHDEERGEYYTNIFSIEAKGSGAGGCFTTVEDVERFWTRLFEGVVVSKNTVKEMTSLHAENTEEKEAYGYGFWLGGDDNNIPFFQGSDPGVSFMTSYCDGVFICAVSNFGDDIWDIHSEVRGTLCTV